MTDRVFVLLVRLQVLALASVRAVHRYLEDTRAVSTVEYALIVVAIIAAMAGIGAVLTNTFNDMFTELGTRMTGAMKNNGS